MTSRSWSNVERAVAHLVGGRRSWETTTGVIVDDYGIEVKHLTAPTVAQLEGYLRINRWRQQVAGRRSALIVKRKGGRGRPTPYLAVFELEETVP